MHHPLVTNVVVVDKMYCQFSAGLEIVLLGIERKHSTWKFLGILMASMYGNFLGFRDLVTSTGQFISILPHNHAASHIH